MAYFLEHDPVCSCAVSDRHCGRVKSLVSYGVSVCGTRTPAHQSCLTVAVARSRVRCVSSEMTTFLLLPVISRWLMSGRCSDR